MKKSTNPSQERDICARKHKGNANSKAANKAVSPIKLAVRKQIYEIIFWAPNGITLEELAVQMSRSTHTISGRISELKQDNKIKCVGTKKTRLRVACAIYKATVHEMKRAAK